MSPTSYQTAPPRVAGSHPTNHVATTATERSGLRATVRRRRPAVRECRSLVHVRRGSRHVGLVLPEARCALALQHGETLLVGGLRRSEKLADGLATLGGRWGRCGPVQHLVDRAAQRGTEARPALVHDDEVVE